MQNSKMSCDKAWTCQELADHADNWSLAGNVGLLKHMEQFAEDLFRQADETNNNLENLLQDLDSTEIQLDLVKNQFLGLQNTQFIESRVYEDDETVVEAVVEPTEPTEVKLDDGRKKELLKTAVVDGLKVLDRYYERMSIPESDSEGDETDCGNYVLREKDPYIHRPLPYVIGTDEWHTKWHAGLAESSDDSDLENENEMKTNGKNAKSRVEDEFSDTDSESNLPVADRRSQVVDYTPQESLHPDPDLYPYEEVNGNSISAKTPITNATFAEQLAAKLGDVLTTPATSSDPEVNTRPIQRNTPVAPVAASLLDDLPPELPDEHFTPTTGLFSGGGGLFDDDDDSSLEKPPPIVIPGSGQKKKVPNLFDEDDDDDNETFLVVPPPIQTIKKTTILQEKKKLGSLFDETDEEDEEVFVPPSVADNYLKKDPGVGVRVGFMPQEPPALETKKPVGGVNVLGGFLPKRQASSSSSGEEDVKSEPKIEKPPPLVEKVDDTKPEKRVLSLFDDTDDLFEDDLFLPAASDNNNKPKTSLFDHNDLEVDKDDDLFAVPPPLISTPKAGVKTIPEEALTKKATKTKTRNLFDESSEDEDDMFSSTVASKSTKTINLFGNDEKNDTVEVLLPSKEISKDVEVDKPVVKPRFSLFDDKPPSLLSDDDWDEPVPPVPVKRKEVVEKFIKTKDEKEEKTPSPEKKLPGKLKHNLNINVNALMPGARLPVSQPTQPEEIVSNIAKEETVEVEEKILVLPTETIIGKQIERKSSQEDEENVKDVKILQSVTKSRVKIPIKRRPSTRKGRQAALATSQNSQDEPITEVIPEINKITSVVVEETKDKQPVVAMETKQTSIVSMETKDKQPVVAMDIETTQTPIVPPETSDDTLPINSPPSLQQSEDIFDDVKPLGKSISLFDDFEDDDDFKVETKDIFAHAPPAATSSAISTPRRQLIVQDNDEDDVGMKPPPLFDEPMIASVQEDSNMDAIVEVKPANPKKISLFDDLDDFHESDDLFSAAEDIYAKKNVDNVRVFDTLPITKTEKDDKVEEKGKHKQKPSLFGDYHEDDDDLFAVKTKTNTKEGMPKDIAKVTKAGTKSLFGEDFEDGDDDLFASSSNSSTKNMKEIKKKPIEGKLGKKHSLFGDDDDDEDIFNTKSSKSAKVKPSSDSSSISAFKTVTAVKTVTSSVKITKNDPLADLFGDSD